MDAWIISGYSIPGVDAPWELRSLRGLFVHASAAVRYGTQGAKPMMNLAAEREHLAKAEMDIVEGERRVAAQALLLERLRRDKHATSDAEKLLLTLRQTLEAWMAHRDEILRAIARLEQTPST